jgi:hypothetical protein
VDEEKYSLKGKMRNLERVVICDKTPFAVSFYIYYAILFIY